MAVLSIKNLHISINGYEKINSGKGILINEGDIILLSGKNGCGKSTILKLIMNDLPSSSAFDATAEIIYKDEYKLINSHNQTMFNREVCYVSQDDLFESNSIMGCCLTSLETDNSIENKYKYALDFIESHKVYESVYSHREILSPNKITKGARKICRQCHIDYKNCEQHTLKAAQYLALNPNDLSGGQKKIANIVSSLIRYKSCTLCIFDEPLNSLDYSNVRFFSNMITSIHKDMPSLSMLIVTHCRSIPIISRSISIENGEIIENPSYSCYSCFGPIDENKYYV